VEVSRVEQVRRRGAQLAEGSKKLWNPGAVCVALECPDGECWLAIGGGETLEQALEYALKRAPSQKRWRVAGWSSYGD
jgi:hypothetical protein